MNVLALTLNRTNTEITRTERNKINENWRLIELNEAQNITRINNVQKEAADNLRAFRDETTNNFINYKKMTDDLRTQILTEIRSNTTLINLAQNTADEALALYNATLNTANRALENSNNALRAVDGALDVARRAENNSLVARETSQRSLDQSMLTARQLENIILNSDTSDAETVAARTNTEVGITYSSLLERLQADFIRFYDPIQFRQHLRNTVRLDIDGGLVYLERTGYQLDGGMVTQNRNPSLEGGHVYARFD